MPTIRAHVYKNNLPAFSHAVEAAIIEAIKKTAFDIVADAIDASPVRTGHLRASNYASPTDGNAWEVGNSANYADKVNFGTRFMSARPFFTNAVEKHRSRHPRNVQAAINKVAQRYAIR